MFSIEIDLCQLNCQDGIQVYNFLYRNGNYKFQPSYVNDRPYFKMGIYGIWWSNGFWIIGSDYIKGQTAGSAYYETDDYCPHQLMRENWALMTAQGWITANEDDLDTSCKYITIKSRYVIAQCRFAQHGF